MSNKYRGQISRVASVGIMTFTVAILAIGAPAYAESGSGDDSSSGKNTERSARVDKTRTSLEIEIKHSVEQQNHINQKREELKVQIQEKKQEIRQKLDDKRLKICQNRENKINQVVANSKTRAQRVLERLQTTEARVREYYQKKELTLSDFQTLSAAIDDKEAAAVAAISVTSETTFKCSEDDATRPGGIISDTVKTQNAALKAYRQAIHDLIVKMKQVQSTTPATEGSN